MIANNPPFIPPPSTYNLPPPFLTPKKKTNRSDLPTTPHTPPPAEMYPRDDDLVKPLCRGAPAEDIGLAATAGMSRSLPRTLTLLLLYRTQKLAEKSPVQCSSRDCSRATTKRRRCRCWCCWCSEVTRINSGAPLLCREVHIRERAFLDSSRSGNAAAPPELSRNVVSDLCYIARWWYGCECVVGSGGLWGVF